MKKATRRQESKLFQLCTYVRELHHYFSTNLLFYPTALVQAFCLNPLKVTSPYNIRQKLDLFCLVCSGFTAGFFQGALLCQHHRTLQLQQKKWGPPASDPGQAVGCAFRSSHPTDYYEAHRYILQLHSFPTARIFYRLPSLVSEGSCTGVPKLSQLLDKQPETAR